MPRLIKSEDNTTTVGHEISVIPNSTPIPIRKNKKISTIITTTTTTTTTSELKKKAKVSTQKPIPMIVDKQMSEKKPITKKHMIEHEENEESQTPRKKPKISNYRSSTVSFSVEQLRELREKFKEEITKKFCGHIKQHQIFWVFQTVI